MVVGFDACDLLMNNDGRFGLPARRYVGGDEKLIYQFAWPYVI